VLPGRSAAEMMKYSAGTWFSRRSQAFRLDLVPSPQALLSKLALRIYGYGLVVGAVSVGITRQAKERTTHQPPRSWFCRIEFAGAAEFLKRRREFIATVVDVAQIQVRPRIERVDRARPAKVFLRRWQVAQFAMAFSEFLHQFRVVWFRSDLLFETLNSF